MGLTGGVFPPSRGPLPPGPLWREASAVSLQRLCASSAQRRSASSSGNSSRLARRLPPGLAITSVQAQGLSKASSRSAIVTSRPMPTESTKVSATFQDVPQSQLLGKSRGRFSAAGSRVRHSYTVGGLRWTLTSLTPGISCTSALISSVI